MYLPLLSSAWISQRPDPQNLAPLQPPQVLKSDKEMHLWPSLKLRNSFKSTHHKRFQRTNSENQYQSSQQKLLSGGGDKDASSSSSSLFAVVCRDVVLLLSCCFCCIACVDDEEDI